MSVACDSWLHPLLNPLLLLLLLPLQYINGPALDILLLKHGPTSFTGSHNLVKLLQWPQCESSSTCKQAVLPVARRAR